LSLNSDVRKFSPGEFPQDDSLAGSRSPGRPAHPGVAAGLASGSSRRFAQPFTNGKHEHFAHLIAKGESPARAYVLSGYSSNGAIQSGRRLLRNPNVSARVAELKTAVSERQVEKIAVDRAWVVAMLTENVRRAMQAEPVLDREGNPSGQYRYEGGVANKALELLGKEFGMFQQKSEDPALKLQATIAILNAGRDRVAKAKLERDAAASNPNDL